MDEMENDPAVRAAKKKAADHAAGEVKEHKEGTEAKWPVIIEGFGIMRQDALHATRTNDIKSGRYRVEFNRQRGLYKHLADFTPSEASACCWAYENPGEYALAKATLNDFYGQAPTPYTVYQKAMRIARAKDNVAKKNSKESREAAQAKAAEADRDRDHALEERDRIMNAGHERHLLTERRLEVVETRNEALEAELRQVRAKVPGEIEAEQREQAVRVEAQQYEAQLKAELEQVRRRNVELEAENAELRARLAEKGGSPAGFTPAAVYADLLGVKAACGGNVSATARALGYKKPFSVGRVLEQGENMSLEQARAMHTKIEAWRQAVVVEVPSVEEGAV